MSCGSPAPLSRAEFLVRADRICEDAQRDLASVVGEFPQEVALDTLPGFAQGYGAAIPILERELDDMRALPPPREDDVDRFLDSQEANIGALNDARGAALKADLDGFQRALDDALDAAKEFRTAGAALGLRSCGRPVTTAQGGGPSPNASAEEDPLLGEASAAARQAGCSAVTSVPPYDSESQDRAHADPIPPLGSYPSVPPASGPHESTTLAAGIYRQPPPVGNLIHSLEHGAVVIWYGVEQADQGSLAEIAAFFGEPSRGDHVIVAPFSYPDEGEAGRLPAGTSMALVAWHRMQSCERLSLGVADAFVGSFRADPVHLENYQGVAPEAGVPI